MDAHSRDFAYVDVPATRLRLLVNKLFYREIELRHRRIEELRRTAGQASGAQASPFSASPFSIQDVYAFEDREKYSVLVRAAAVRIAEAPRVGAVARCTRSVWLRLAPSDSV